MYTLILPAGHVVGFVDFRRSDLFKDSDWLVHFFISLFPTAY